MCHTLFNAYLHLNRHHNIYIQDVKRYWKIVNLRLNVVRIFGGFTNKTVLASAQNEYKYSQAVSSKFKNI